MRLDDLDYELPPALIAQRPLEERDGARLLVLDGDAVAHRAVMDLPDLLAPSLIVVNDTRVRPARLFGERPTGGQVEVLLIEQLDELRWVAMTRSSKPLKVGARFSLGGEIEAEVLAVREGGHRELALRSERPLEAVLADKGQVPLPPYIERPPDEDDDDRYQTVFADAPGAVAAPTAGLHFSERLIARLEAAGHRFARVTLHVGPGTFRPVKVAHLDEHEMHAEAYEVGEATAAAIAEARAEGRPILAVGTTVVRTLEAAAEADGVVRAGAGRTALFIRPGFSFRVIDALMTNFHLPRSTLLALVMAFGGEAVVRDAYRAAVAERYRFFSYGDAMLVRPARD